MPLNILLNISSGPKLTINLHDLVTLAIVTLVVTVVLGFIYVVVAILVGIYQVRKQHSQKQVMYQVLTDRPVVRIENEVKGKIKIEYDGRIVDSISFVILKLWNSGDISIKSKDYLEPLTFKFEGRKVLEVNIRNIEPENLIKPTDIGQFLQENKPTPGNEKDLIVLPAFHLNPKGYGKLQDALTLGVLLLGSNGKINAEGRIDEGDIARFKFLKMGPMIFALAVLIIASVIAYLLLNGYVSFTFKAAYMIPIFSTVIKWVEALIYFSN